MELLLCWALAIFFIYVQVPVVLKVLDFNSKMKYGSCKYNPRHPSRKGGGLITWFQTGCSWNSFSVHFPKIGNRGTG